MGENKNILWLFALQMPFTPPFLNLYVDMERKTVVLAVRASKPSEIEKKEYICADVTLEQVDGYIEGKLRLSDIFKEPQWKYTIIENKVYTEPFAGEYEPSREFGGYEAFDEEWFYYYLEWHACKRMWKDGTLFSVREQQTNKDN